MRVGAHGLSQSLRLYLSCNRQLPICEILGYWLPVLGAYRIRKRLSWQHCRRQQIWEFSDFLQKYYGAFCAWVLRSSKESIWARFPTIVDNEQLESLDFNCGSSAFPQPGGCGSFLQIYAVDCALQSQCIPSQNSKLHHRSNLFVKRPIVFWAAIWDGAAQLNLWNIFIYFTCQPRVAAEHNAPNS